MEEQPCRTNRALRKTSAWGKLLALYKTALT
jgi:hypothetical protein